MQHGSDRKTKSRPVYYIDAAHAVTVDNPLLLTALTSVRRRAGYSRALAIKFGSCRRKVISQINHLGKSLCDHSFHDHFFYDQFFIQEHKTQIAMGKLSMQISMHERDAIRIQHIAYLKYVK